jgi:hypothetical protein
VDANDWILDRTVVRVRLERRFSAWMDARECPVN